MGQTYEFADRLDLYIQVTLMVFPENKFTKLSLEKSANAGKSINIQSNLNNFRQNYIIHRSKFLLHPFNVIMRHLLILSSLYDAPMKRSCLIPVIYDLYIKKPNNVPSLYINSSISKINHIINLFLDVKYIVSNICLRFIQYPNYQNNNIDQNVTHFLI